jgi:hypothetical protein
VYHHDPAVSNPREAHVALDGKAFRYDDPFWETYYPPNGWGCQCYVSTESEASAKKEGIETGDSCNETLPEIDKTWAYNVGQNALAPNFDKYTQLPERLRETLREQYRRDIEKFKTTADELKTLRDEIAQRKPPLDDDLPPNDPKLYLAGNIDKARQEAMGIDDSKIMITGYRIYHSFTEKNAKQAIPQELFNDLNKLIQEPDYIYKKNNPDNPALDDEFHFSKRYGGGKNRKILNVVLRKAEGYTLRIITMGFTGDGHKDKTKYICLLKLKKPPPLAVVMY